MDGPPVDFHKSTIAAYRKLAKHADRLEAYYQSIEDVPGAGGISHNRVVTLDTIRPRRWYTRREGGPTMTIHELTRIREVDAALAFREGLHVGTLATHGFRASFTLDAMCLV